MGEESAVEYDYQRKFPHVRLLAFDARVSKSLAQETMLASYAARDFYVLTRNPTRDSFSVHANLLASHFTQ